MITQPYVTVLSLSSAAGLNAEVLNKAALSDIFHIQIPERFPHGFVFLSGAELVGNDVEEIENCPQYRIEGHYWIDIPKAVMNTEVGYHKYRFQFVDCVTADVLNLFAAYIIQDDDPEKPYIYMVRPEENA